MSRRAIVDRLAAALESDLMWDPNGVPVISVTVSHVGDLWNPAVVALTARQAWWLSVRLGQRPATHNGQNGLAETTEPVELAAPVEPAGPVEPDVPDGEPGSGGEVE